MLIFGMKSLRIHISNNDAVTKEIPGTHLFCLYLGILALLMYLYNGKAKTPKVQTK